MEYRTLGRTGVNVSPLCLGALNFGGPTGKDESFRMLDTALDAGINFVDIANIYNGGESERVVGEALQHNGKRDQVVLATKFQGQMGEGINERGASRYHIMKACDDSLRRLQTDHIDLYQLHRPNFDIPQDETLRALDDLVRAGKVRYIGCSTFPAWYLMEALATSEKYGLARYICEQPPYNLLDRRIENELVPLCRKHGLGIIPWSPIASGLLAGRYPVNQEVPSGSRLERSPGIMQKRINRSGRLAGERMQQIAAERGMTAAQLALLWCKDQPGITAPITGPRTMEQLQEALAVLDMHLDDDLRARLDEINPPGSVISDFHNTSGWMKMYVPD